LVKNQIHYTTKVGFLSAFKTAFDQVFTLSNIQDSFRGSDIYPFGPEAVLSKFDVIIRTPSPELPGDLAWEPQTPKNAQEMELQPSLLSSKIASHQNFSPIHIKQALAKLKRGAQQMAASAAMMASQISDLEKANTKAERRKVCQNKFLSSENRLFISKVDVLGPRDHLNSL
jgi:hypothetical protein